MLCSRCRREIPDGSRYCNICGKRQGKATPKPKARRAKGNGSIIKKKGLKRPYLARYDGAYLGYYLTAEQAEEAISAAKAKGPDLAYGNYTMQKVFDALTSTREWESKSAGYKADTKSTWNYMVELHQMKAKDVRHETLQAVIYRAQDEDKSQSHQHKLRVLMKKLCRWCMQHGIHAVDYSEGLSINNNIKGERTAFTDSDLKKIYQHRDDRACAITWILCMTGCRPVDLGKIRKNGAIDMKRRGIWLEGSKTAAGKNRFVLVDEITWDIFLRFYDEAKPMEPIFKNKTGGPWDASSFRRYEFYQMLDNLNIPSEKYVLYSCRHTFATLAERSGVDKESLQRAIGHEIGSGVTDEHYIDQATHVDKAVSEFAKMGAQIKKITG